MSSDPWIPRWVAFSPALIQTIPSPTRYMLHDLELEGARIPRGHKLEPRLSSPYNAKRGNTATT